MASILETNIFSESRTKMKHNGLIINSIAANARPVYAQGSVFVVNDEEIWSSTV